MKFGPVKSLLGVALMVATLLTIQMCKSSASASKAKEPEVVVSYAADILPLMQTKCTPCHFPAQGKKKMLDNYDAVASSITDILLRIQLPAADEKFMPFKSKRPPLTAEEIQLFINWKKQGMLQ